MGLSSPGVGSNLDVNSIVSQLMSVEKQPLNNLATSETAFQAKLTGFGTLKNVVTQFQTSMTALADLSKFQAVRVSSGDNSVASASATGAATPGTYALEVSKLAQAQKLAAAGQASATASIGAGASTTISFDLGSITGGAFDSTTGHYTGAAFASSGAGIKTVTIGSNNSLSDIRDAINKTDIGVSASIVNDGSGTPYRLTLTVNATGKSSSLKVSVAGDPAISSLLTHDPSVDAGQAFSEMVAAQNAEFKVDGIAISKATNSVTDVISGLTLNLAKTNAGSPTNITVARDTGSVVNSVNAFVKAYNDLSQNLRDAAAYNATTNQGAVLNGETAVRSIQTQMRNVLSAPVSGATGAYSLLSQVGISMGKDGLLAVDSTKLQAAVDTHFNDVAGLFAAAGTTGVGSSQGYASQFKTLAQSFLGSDGPIASRTDGINASLKRIAADRVRLNSRLVDTEARYRAQFTALDVSIGAMTSTSTFLTQQLANLSKNSL